MSEILKKKAKKLAELDGCMAQDVTAEEAVNNLVEVRVEYTLHFLENGLPVPQLALTSLVSTGSSLYQE